MVLGGVGGPASCLVRCGFCQGRDERKPPLLLGRSCMTSSTVRARPVRTTSRDILLGSAMVMVASPGWIEGEDVDRCAGAEFCNPFPSHSFFPPPLSLSLSSRSRLSQCIFDCQKGGPITTTATQRGRLSRQGEQLAGCPAPIIGPFASPTPTGRGSHAVVRLVDVWWTFGRRWWAPMAVGARTRTVSGPRVCQVGRRTHLVLSTPASRYIMMATGCSSISRCARCIRCIALLRLQKQTVARARI